MTNPSTMYRSSDGCCICRTKTSTSRFTSSAKYEDAFSRCFLVDDRAGQICNACVLIVKRFRNNTTVSDKNWYHKVDSKMPGKRKRGKASPESPHKETPVKRVSKKHRYVPKASRAEGVEPASMIELADHSSFYPFHSPYPEIKRNGTSSSKRTLIKEPFLFDDDVANPQEELARFIGNNPCSPASSSSSSRCLSPIYPTPVHTPDLCMPAVPSTSYAYSMPVSPSLSNNTDDLERAYHIDEELEHQQIELAESDDLESADDDIESAEPDDIEPAEPEEVVFLEPEPVLLPVPEQMKSTESETSLTVNKKNINDKKEQQIPRPPRKQRHPRRDIQTLPSSPFINSTQSEFWQLRESCCGSALVRQNADMVILQKYRPCPLHSGARPTVGTKKTSRDAESYHPQTRPSFLSQEKELVVPSYISSSNFLYSNSQNKYSLKFTSSITSTKLSEKPPFSYSALNPSSRDNVMDERTLRNILQDAEKMPITCSDQENNLAQQKVDAFGALDLTTGRHIQC